MAEKPQTRAGYPPELALLARATCLYVATVLGDLIEEITVVGGLVPSLLITPQDDSVEVHAGTRTSTSVYLSRCSTRSDTRRSPNG